MSFQQGLSGLNAAAKNLDIVGNNVANANTVGFKGAVGEFSDIFAAAGSGSGSAAVGIGTQLSRVAQQFTQGNISVSSNPLDMAINGNGFFRISNGGTVSYTRNGQFSLDRNGYVVNAGGGRLTGYLASAGGTLVTSAPTDLQIIQADIAPKTTANVTAGVNLDSRKTIIAAPFDITDATTYHSATSLSVYDSLGNAHAVSVYFAKSAANVWDVYAACDGAQIGAGSVGTLTFDGATGLIDATATTLPFAISATVTTGATDPMPIDLDFTGTTQFGSAFGVNSLNQDGYGSGRLGGYSISSDGIIQGRYSNGQTKTLGQVVMANFTNPGGLESVGSNGWGETIKSGPALVGVPGTGSLGSLQSGALEDSNIDVTAELVKMIMAQRVYQSNAQSIKTQDAVLQTLVNMR
jgi:flagellar hook protein FlgE